MGLKASKSKKYHSLDNVVEDLMNNDALPKALEAAKSNPGKTIHVLYSSSDDESYFREPYQHPFFQGLNAKGYVVAHNVTKSAESIGISWNYGDTTIAYRLPYRTSDINEMYLNKIPTAKEVRKAQLQYIDACLTNIDEQLPSYTEILKDWKCFVQFVRLPFNLADARMESRPMFQAWKTKYPQFTMTWQRLSDPDESQCHLALKWNIQDNTPDVPKSKSESFKGLLR